MVAALDAGRQRVAAPIHGFAKAWPVRARVFAVLCQEDVATVLVEPCCDRLPLLLPGPLLSAGQLRAQPIPLRQQRGNVLGLASEAP